MLLGYWDSTMAPVQNSPNLIGTRVVPRPSLLAMKTRRSYLDGNLAVQEINGSVGKHWADLSATGDR